MISKALVRFLAASLCLTSLLWAEAARSQSSGQPGASICCNNILVHADRLVTFVQDTCGWDNEKRDRFIDTVKGEFSKIKRLRSAAPCQASTPSIKNDLLNFGDKKDKLLEGCGAIDEIWKHAKQAVDAFQDKCSIKLLLPIPSECNCSCSHSLPPVECHTCCKDTGPIHITLPPPTVHLTFIPEPHIPAIVASELGALLFPRPGMTQTMSAEAPLVIGSQGTGYGVGAAVAPFMAVHEAELQRAIAERDKPRETLKHILATARTMATAPAPTGSISTAETILAKGSGEPVPIDAPPYPKRFDRVLREAIQAGGSCTIRLLKDLETRANDIHGSFNKDVGNLSKKVRALIDPESISTEMRNLIGEGRTLPKRERLLRNEEQSLREAAEHLLIATRTLPHGDRELLNDVHDLLNRIRTLSTDSMDARRDARRLINDFYRLPEALQGAGDLLEQARSLSKFSQDLLDKTETFAKEAQELRKEADALSISLQGVTVTPGLSQDEQDLLNNAHGLLKQASNVSVEIGELLESRSEFPQSIRDLLHEVSKLPEDFGALLDGTQARTNKLKDLSRETRDLLEELGSLPKKARERLMSVAESVDFDTNAMSEYCPDKLPTMSLLQRSLALSFGGGKRAPGDFVFGKGSNFSVAATMDLLNTADPFNSDSDFGKCVQREIEALGSDRSRAASLGAGIRARCKDNNRVGRAVGIGAAASFDNQGEGDPKLSRIDAWFAADKHHSNLAFTLYLDLQFSRSIRPAVLEGLRMSYGTEIAMISVEGVFGCGFFDADRGCTLSGGLGSTATIALPWSLSLSTSPQTKYVEGIGWDGRVVSSIGFRSAPDPVAMGLRDKGFAVE